MLQGMGGSCYVEMQGAGGLAAAVQRDSLFVVGIAPYQNSGFRRCWVCCTMRAPDVSVVLLVMLLGVLYISGVTL